VSLIEALKERQLNSHQLQLLYFDLQC